MSMSRVSSLLRSSIVPLAVLQCHATSSPMFYQAPHCGVSHSRMFCEAASASDTPPPSSVDLNKSFEDMKSRLQEIERLSGISALMSWDEAVMMREGSSVARNRQSGALAGVIFEKKTAVELGQAIDALNSPSGVALFSSKPTDFAIIREATRDYFLEINKTKELVTKSAELEGRGYTEWVKAREENNWDNFKGVLADIVNVKQEIAAATQPSLSNYDANIDMYERGMTSHRIGEIFTFLKDELDPLISKIATSSAKKQYVAPDALKGSELWKVDKQKEMCLEIAKAMGFDFERGRLDESVHPFTGGPHPTDVRITTRYSTENWLEGIAGTIHEVGHGLYEQGRNSDWDDLPISRALSMGVHESQSLFWERMIFQSRDFWVYATPLVHKYFPHTKDCSVDDFYAFVNRVEPGFIRVDADEVTYPIHIILRFEMEKQLFQNESTGEDVMKKFDKLPQQWNDVMKSSLGLVVPSHRHGILQDVHWPMGAFGYFPSYTLGAIIAVQLYNHALLQIPDMKGKVQRGEFKDIREHLRKEIHEVGSFYASPDELLLQVTGEKMNPSYFISYLDNKYKKLYKLD